MLCKYEIPSKALITIVPGWMRKKINHHDAIYRVEFQNPALSITPVILIGPRASIRFRLKWKNTTKTNGPVFIFFDEYLTILGELGSSITLYYFIIEFLIRIFSAAQGEHRPASRSNFGRIAFGSSHTTFRRCPVEKNGWNRCRCCWRSHHSSQTKFRSPGRTGSTPVRGKTAWNSGKFETLRGPEFMMAFWRVIRASIDWLFISRFAPVCAWLMRACFSRDSSWIDARISCSMWPGRRTCRT